MTPRPAHLTLEVTGHPVVAGPRSASNGARADKTADLRSPAATATDAIGSPPPSWAVESGIRGRASGGKTHRPAGSSAGNPFNQARPQGRLGRR